MNEKTVTIEIDEHGNCAVDLAGFQGKSCEDVAKAFRAGDAVVKSRLKREFHVHVALRQSGQQRTR